LAEQSDDDSWVREIFQRVLKRRGVKTQDDCVKVRTHQWGTVQSYTVIVARDPARAVLTELIGYPASSEAYSVGTWVLSDSEIHRLSEEPPAPARSQR